MVKKAVSAFFAALAVFIIAAVVLIALYRWYERISYRTEYSELVETYSQEYGIDKNFVYAVIRTESNFDPNAVSDAGAIGLMQMIEDSFDWVSEKLGETELEFEDLFQPEHSIRFGCYLLSFLYQRYGNYELTAAAYHSGMGEVDGWLASGAVNRASPDITSFSGSNIRNYVYKVMKAFEKYNKIASNERN